MALTSEQVNFIVYRYLQESGFRHSSFTFQHESQVHNSAYRDIEIQPGALINVIHKGLQFMEIEAHMNEDGELMECNVPFSLLEPHHCELTGKTFTEADTASDAPTPSTKRQRKDKTQKEGEKRARRETSREESSLDMHVNGRDSLQESVSSSTLSPATNASTNAATTTTTITATTVMTKEERASVDAETVEGVGADVSIDPKDVVVLKGHQSEVYTCTWNPVDPLLLASGSGDATARLWHVPENTENVPSPIVLNHIPTRNPNNQDVTSLDWNPSGTLLATGSYDGQARIWTRNGDLRYVMNQHKGPIFSLKWNRKGDMILSGSADCSTVVWDNETGEMKQHFKLHTAAILDVDWMDNTTFASCSSDKAIYVCRVGSTTPIKEWLGHEDEINAVRWDPTSQYLASCSDDVTTKIWSLSSDKPVQEIRGHTLQIYTLQWAPYTGGAENAPRILATASFDATIRLWDALKGECLRVLQDHTEPVYSISFSPDASLLASGSFDRRLNVWDTKDGGLKKTFKTNGGIFEVHFNKTGEKLAACTSDKEVNILDMKS